jgi:outer membrane immunogenic protein
VLGVEGDFDWADLDSYAQIVYAPAAPYLGRTDTLSYSVDWFGTVRGRLGYAWDNLLLYATGGLAYGRVASTYHAVLSDQTIYDGAVAKRRSGWALGAGGEWAFSGNWSGRAEYLHIDLGSFDYNAGQVGNPLFAWHNDVETKVDVVRFGVNYRFDDLLADLD